MNFLEIVAKEKRKEIEELKRKYKNLQLRKRKVLSLKERILNHSRISIIAEIKLASPSEGKITDRTVKQIAEIYNKFDIAAISVLCDKKFFQGSYKYLGIVKDLTDKPVLCKDFILDEFQIYLAYYFGADAVLLITEFLEWDRLLKLYEYASKFGMEILVESHTEENLKKCVKERFEIIGINNRDLKTFKVSLKKCVQLVKYIPEHKVKVAESGIHTAYDLKLLENSNFNAALIGTTILKSDNITKKLKELTEL